ncbi:MAG: zinc-ribbon domain-containing protein [Desulfatiglandaceae bacterium]
MKCPHCEKEIGGVRCPHCSRENPEEANYCMYCGSVLGIEEAPEEEVSIEQTDDYEDLDLDSRILCPDGACTGIIVNGRCTECGRRYPDEGEVDGGEADGGGEKDV